MRQFGLIFPLFLAASAPGWAQWLFVEEDSWTRIAQPPGKAVIADITATLTSQTPLGSFTHTETGTYWRSRSGKARQDTSHGQSTVVDLGSLPRSLAFIDHDLQRIFKVTGTRPVTRFGQPREDATGADFRLGDGTARPKKSGQEVLDGFKVTIRTGQLRHGQSYEIWTADELKIVLLFKLQSDTDEFVQRYHNIRLEEADPSIFELPRGFRMVTIPAPSDPCMRAEVGVSGEPRPAETVRLCAP